jgi:hypothetical protein
VKPTEHGYPESEKPEGPVEGLQPIPDPYGEPSDEDIRKEDQQLALDEND